MGGGIGSVIRLIRAHNKGSTVEGFGVRFRVYCLVLSREWGNGYWGLSLGTM